MIRRGLFFSKFLVFFLFFIPFVRLSSTPQEVAQLQKPLEHQVTVTLKLIQVYVTDKKGNPVPDLKKEDFIVYDNGRAMTLTEFEKHILERAAQKPEPRPAEEKILPTPLPAPGVMNRKFFLFFDFAFNSQKGIKKAREAALHFIDTEIIPGDEVGLLSYSTLKGLSIHEYLTTNHKILREAVEGLTTKGIAGRAENFEEEYWRRAQEEIPQDEGIIWQKKKSQLFWERQESKNQAQNFILKLTALAKALRYVPGQKQLILFSAGIVNSLIYGNQAGNPTENIPGVRTQFDPGDYVLRTQHEEMLKELSAANCAFFTFDTREAAMVASLFAYDNQTFEDRYRDLFSEGGVHQTPVNILKDDKITGHYSLSRLSNITGGKYFSNIEEYRKNLDQLQNLTGSYYVLGYYIGEQLDGQHHKIKVDVKRKGVEVRAQSGYFNPKPFREYTDLEKQLHLFDLALSDTPLLQTPLTFSLSALSYAVGEGARLEMLSKIPARVTEKFAGKKVELVALVFDENENLVRLQRTEADLAKYRGMDVFCASGAALQPGSYKCRLVIRDLDSGTGAVASARANVAKKAFVGLSLHSPLLLVPESSFAYLEAAAAKKKEATAWNDAYPFDRALYSPLVGEAPKGTPKIFAVVPCSMTGLVQPSITLTAWLVNSVSGERLPLPFSVLNKARKEDVEIQFLELPLTDVPPGKYLLYLHAEDAVSMAVSYAQTTLIITQ
jgi:VWFA-related protein